ncbi:MAG: tRNA (adenosine(37)-N6)-threonylcarbamoyltransferase complex dimerization subunit type 1 TsaB [Clostridia bacterium]|nr:tRNA (adenosine(37)-N6)-threonylcarbamoyltransferase complex dimerization subunit type 1 TsaB [Clostridia bacterium]
MSNFLAVDTSSRHLTVVAQKGSKKKVNYIADCAMNHSVALMDEIVQTLNEVGLTAAECDYFVAVTGPGSFTGIRIGISCVKGYAVALGKSAYGVTTFDMLSYNVNSDCDYLIAVDAGRGNYYVCAYSADGNKDGEAAFLSEEKLNSLGRPVYGFEELSLPLYTRLKVENCLCVAAEKCQSGEGGGLSALYVKKPQAEEEREARLKRV